MRHPAALKGGTTPGEINPGRVLPLVCLLLLSRAVAGCAHYIPVDVRAPLPHGDVRVTVTEDAALRVGPYLGNVRRNLEGTLEPYGSDSLRLAVWVGKNYMGTEFEDFHQFVHFSYPEILQVRRRQISALRTGVAAAGIVAAMVVLIDRMDFLEDPNASGNKNPHQPPPQDALIVRIRFDPFR